MPVFHFKLTDTDSGESRSVSVAADSLEEAEATVLRQEQKKVDFFLGDADVKDLETKLKEGTLTGADKGRLFSHRQEAPYKIQKAKGE
jgi:hypothetical protein